MATGLDGIVQWSNDVLSRIKFAVLVCPSFEIFAQHTTSDGHVIPINEFILEQEREDLWNNFLFRTRVFMHIEKKGSSYLEYRRACRHLP